MQPVKRQFSSVRVTAFAPLREMAPASFGKMAFSIRKCRSVKDPGAPHCTRKMRCTLFPERVTPCPAPLGPMISNEFKIKGRLPEMRVMVCAVANTPAVSNWITSAPAAAFASVIACRREPGPVSFTLVTVKVAAHAWQASKKKEAVAMKFLKRRKEDVAVIGRDGASPQNCFGRQVAGAGEKNGSRPAL